MSEKVTFGCGTFLPGLGPGNVTQFDSGGTIDSGGGNDTPDPPTPIDPSDDAGDVDDVGGIGGDPPGPDPGTIVGDPINPNAGPGGAAPPPTFGERCVCTIITGGSPNYSDNGNQVNGGRGGEIVTVTRVYGQECRSYPNKVEADAAREANDRTITRQDPPARPGDWEQVGAAVSSPRAGTGCKVGGQCGGSCPNITVRSYWKRRSFRPPGDTGTGGGAAPPPPGPIELGCLCVIINDSPTPNEFIVTGGDSPAGATHAVTRIFPTGCFPINDPALNAETRERNTNIINSASTEPPSNFNGQWVQVGSPEIDGEVNKSCKDQSTGECGGSCDPIRVTTYWKRLGATGGGSSSNNSAILLGEGGPGFNRSGGGLEDDNPASGGFISVGGEDDLGNEGADFSIDNVGNQVKGSGQGASVKKYSSLEDITREAVRTGSLDLNDPTIVNSILKKKPYGIQDSTIAFITNPPAPKQVSNDSGYTEFFKDPIDSNLLYVLKTTKSGGNWDSRRAAAITPELIVNSLNDSVKEILDRIRNFDGSPLTQVQIFNMIGSRVLDGTLKNLSIGYLQKVAEDSEKRVPVTITRSSSEQVNEVAALALIEQNMFPLEPSAIGNGRDSELIRNWKIVPSDVDMYIPFVVDGELKRFYINDDETFIDRVTLSLQDGNYFDILGGDLASQRLFAESEADHAFYIPESTRQKAIQILGGEAGRTLTVSADAETASGIEYDSSLSSPRQSYYLLSGVLSSLETQPSLSPSFLLKDSRMEYKLIDTVTAEGQAEADEYIRYKANKRIFVLDHEDLILDYIEDTSSVYLSQTDVLFDSPKENKTIPLLTRQIPWYIMVVPTNRTDYNLFNSKSRILEITSDGSMTRQLRCKTSIVPEFSKRQTNKFIKYSTVGKEGVDVLGESNTQARQTIIEVNDSDFKKTYSLGGKLVGADEYTTPRDKTPIRIVREIINELDTNYELSINGIGKSLTEFDVFSRLTVKQFNKLSRLESFDTIKKAVQNGLINDVKIIPPVSKADNRISFKKTQLVQRKKAAGVDSFKQIKATNTGQNIVSPDTDGVGGFTPAG